MSMQIQMEEGTKQAPVPVRMDSVVVAVAVVVACGFWSFWTQVVGVDLTVRAASGTQSIGAPAVLATVLVVSLFGVGLLRVLEARTRRGVRTWTIVALCVYAVSLLGPLGATSAAAWLVLTGLHTVVAGVLVLGLRQVREPQSLAA